MTLSIQNGKYKASEPCLLYAEIKTLFNPILGLVAQGDMQKRFLHELLLQLQQLQCSSRRGLIVLYLSARLIFISREYSLYKGSITVRLTEFNQISWAVDIKAKLLIQKRMSATQWFVPLWRVFYLAHQTNFPFTAEFNLEKFYSKSPMLIYSWYFLYHDKYFLNFRLKG